MCLVDKWVVFIFVCVVVGVDGDGEVIGVGFFDEFDGFVGVG